MCSFLTAIDTTAEDAADATAATGAGDESLFADAKMEAVPDHLLTDVGVKTARLIMDAADPLQMLRRISGDFPLLASSIVNSKRAAYDNDFRSALTLAGRNFVFVNERLVDLDHFDAFRYNMASVWPTPCEIFSEPYTPILVASSSF